MALSDPVAILPRGMEFVEVPAGGFRMGGIAEDKFVTAVELPRHRVEVKAFALGRAPVTRGEWRALMGSLPPGSPPGLADDCPVVCVTFPEVMAFLRELGILRGEPCRLPSEAEWEYACRAGTSSAWSFGDDPAQLGDYGWFQDNADYTYQKVGTKKPNPWGIHDMHGNVSEWCLDAYLPDAYAKWENGAKNPWHPAVNRYPHVTRGGHYFEGGPETLRSAVRVPSDPSWKAIDPQNPKSIWYLTSCQFIGFRVVRPLAVPDVKEMHRTWNTGPGPSE